jgi:hypothetical protein
MIRRSRTSHQPGGRRVERSGSQEQLPAPHGEDDLSQSSTSLHLWFYGIYFTTSTRCEISAKQLDRELGVTYKTAPRHIRAVRTLMADNISPLAGQVEMDET